MTDTTETKRQRGRKVAAILAGGLVLGVGTMATLATWNDAEYANATFKAGTFHIQGSADNTAWQNHPSSGPAALAFTVAPQNLSPNDTVYAPFAVKLSSDTTNDATVTITAASTGVTTGLTYTLIQPTAWGCAAGTQGTELVPAQALGAAAGAKTFTLTKAAGSTAYLCFKVSASTAMAQGQAATATWTFTGVSQ